MKSLIVLCVTLLAAVAAESVQEKWNKVHMECQSDKVTHVEEIIFEKLRKNESVTLPPNFGLHAFCMLKKLDLQDSNGHVKEDGVKGAVERSTKGSEDDEKIVKECSGNKETGEATALALFECFRKHRIDIGQF